MNLFERTHVTVRLDAIAQNYQSIRREFGKTAVMTVLKGNAYGHGISGIVPVCEQHTDWYAVATVDEAVQIRKNGGKKPVLLFGPVPTARMAEAAAMDLTFTVGSLAYARTLEAQLLASGQTAAIQLKIDTGLNRTGIRWREDTRQEAMEELHQICGISCLRVVGTYTHLACPESDDPDDAAFTQNQFDLFRDACHTMEENGLPTGLQHCCSTGGSLAHPEFRLDMVRLGMMVLGQCDTLEHKKQLGLQEALCWKSQLVQISNVRAGESISYGRTFKAEKDMVVGVVSCGYADGYRRSYQKFGTVLVDGQRVRQIGRICMDYMLVDLTDIAAPVPGMEVVLLGTQKTETISAIELSDAAESVCGEVTGAISARVPRYYIN